MGVQASDTVLQFSEADVNISICLWENEDGENLYCPCTVVGFAAGKHTLRYWKDSSEWTGAMSDEVYTVFHRSTPSQGAATPPRHTRTRASASAANENSRRKIGKVCHQGAEKKDYKLGDLVGVHVSALDANGLDDKFVLGVVCDVPHPNKYRVWANAGVLNVCYPAAKLELMTEAVRSKLNFKYEVGSDAWRKLKQVALGTAAREGSRASKDAFRSKKGCKCTTGKCKTSACPCRNAGMNCGSFCHTTLKGCCNKTTFTDA
ncbi:hypothetical protein CYMTET_15677 [Cymbomonas tetramitiformis]|uniref:Tesmin/TSO1-like CXC domain-containing protein n=1 Tax=Cymbomonas tetramitiformis TaxID=36881 RepID=A0AAE0C6C6_9CHLO|nr:hypothetical protein CYMTET_41351 [Cymbomonas tetramitiformis]KAK3276238.1 hypothetical protein CYMTET_15677 [Cymbomonas tetramitiformis]